MYRPTWPTKQRRIRFTTHCTFRLTVPQDGIHTVAGDFDAPISPSDESACHIVGRFRLGQGCGNRFQLMNFSDVNGLAVRNTCFQHPKKHPLTWYSNNGRTTQQINHILVHFSPVEDCRAFRATTKSSKCCCPRNVGKTCGSVNHDRDTVEHYHQYTNR